MAPIVTQYHDCRILYKGQLIQDDLWVEDGKIIDPQVYFFEKKRPADIKVNCHGLIAAPGFIDLQINGGFGVDFSTYSSDLLFGLTLVSKGLLAHGVTSFCATLISSLPKVYTQILPILKPRPGGLHGARLLGAHVEGPFINVEKRGAHSAANIRNFDIGGFKDVLAVYGSLDNVKIVTLAPELKNADNVVAELTKRGISVSIGHSMCSLEQAEYSVRNGVSFITHLFNSMLPFHHRDPGMVGLLTSDNTPADRTVYYGMIADGIHTHPAALRIAHRAHPEGLVLVTDAMAAQSLPPGQYRFGDLHVDVHDGKVTLAGKDTIAGSVATFDHCVRYFKQATGCSLIEALEAGSTHPAKLLGIDKHIGILDYGSDADFILINNELVVQSTYIAGQLVWQRDHDDEPT